jgi:hypothetical protein
MGEAAGDRKTAAGLFPLLFALDFRPRYNLFGAAGIGYPPCALLAKET